MLTTPPSHTLFGFPVCLISVENDEINPKKIAWWKASLF